MEIKGTEDSRQRRKSANGNEDSELSFENCGL